MEGGIPLFYRAVTSLVSLRHFALVHDAPMTNDMRRTLPPPSISTSRVAAICRSLPLLSTIHLPNVCDSRRATIEPSGQLRRLTTHITESTMRWAVAEMAAAAQVQPDGHPVPSMWIASATTRELLRGYGPDDGLLSITLDTNALGGLGGISLREPYLQLATLPDVVDHLAHLPFSHLAFQLITLVHSCTLSTVDLGTSVALLREFLADLDLGEADVRVWIEGLPRSADSATRLLDDLAR